MSFRLGEERQSGGEEKGGNEQHSNGDSSAVLWIFFAGDLEKGPDRNNKEDQYNTSDYQSHKSIDTPFSEVVEISVTGFLSRFLMRLCQSSSMLDAPRA